MNNSRLMTYMLQLQFNYNLFYYYFQCERMSGCYPVSVATIDLVKIIIETSTKVDPQLPSYAVASCQFILREVFSLFGNWLRNDPESWENIGEEKLRLICLDLIKKV